MAAPLFRRLTPPVCSGLAIAMVLLWQAATVSVNFGGNWTALFYTGARGPFPASLASENIYRFPGSRGYDGQMYHYVAHDPSLRTQDLRDAVDNSRLRYRRILVSGLAWTLAGGRAEAVDAAYFAVLLGFLGLGVYWSCELCARYGYPHALGLAYLLLPAVMITVDRSVVDGALAACTIGFARYWERPSRRLWMVLMAATLIRETGWLLLAGYCAFLLLESQWKQAAAYAMGFLPAAAWYGYVHSVTTAEYDPVSFVPLSSLLRVLSHPLPYPPGVPWLAVVQSADALALSAMLVAFGLVFLSLRKGGWRSPEVLAALLFTALGCLYQFDGLWTNAFDFGRVYTPLLILLVVQSLRSGRFIWMTPWIMMAPRVGMQFSPQVLNIVKHTF